jgi:hypothetical protein
MIRILSASSGRKGESIRISLSGSPDPVSGMHCWHQAVRVEPAAQRTSMETLSLTRRDRMRYIARGLIWRGLRRAPWLAQAALVFASCEADPEAYIVKERT